MIRSPSIRILAPLLFGTPVLAVGLWLSVMWDHQSERAVAQLADQNIEQIHDMTATKVADVLSMPVRVCQMNAHLVESKALDLADLDAWRPTFVRESRVFDMLSAIVWGGADGRCVWVSRYADGTYYWAAKDDPSTATMCEWRLNDQGGISAKPTNTFQFDLAARPWFQTPRDAHAPSWSDPFVWVGGVDSQGMTLGISYGIPLYDADQQLLGVVDADYSLNDLSRFLGSLKIGKTGIAFLATRDARLLATSDATQLITPEGTRVDAAHCPNPLIAAVADFIRHPGAGQDTRGEMEYDGQVHYLCASCVGREVGLDWILMTIIPKQDFTAGIESEFRRSWLTSLLAVLVAAAFGLVSARWLVAPLVKLATAVRRIGQGDLETRVQIHHAPEYMNLATEINKMTVGLQDRMRMQKSLSLAMEVQRNLLPSDAPTVSGLDIAGHSLYCDETGGDYFDFLDVTGADEDTAVVAVGDVMGHGVAAALLMATARGILRSRCAIAGSLADFLGHLNDMLVVDTQGERFMTMLLVTISANREEMRWASAGHDPPIVYNPGLDTFLQLDGGGLPLGLQEGESYLEYRQSGIASGSVILTCTDGLTESMNEDGEIFGIERLQQVLRKSARKRARDISEEIRETLAQYRGPLAQDDDLTFVVAKVL